MDALLHLTVNAWLTGLGCPRHPMARTAWLLVRLRQRHSRIEYVGNTHAINRVTTLITLTARVTAINRDWLPVVETMLAGGPLRVSSIANGVRRYSIHRRGGRV